MKTLSIMMFLFTAMLAGAISQRGEPRKLPEDSYPPEVRAFIMRCLEDDSPAYEDSVKWLRQQKGLNQKHQDHMWEIVSGLAWEKNKVRGRALALEIKNPEKRQEVLAHYDELDRLNDGAVNEKGVKNPPGGG